MGVVALSSEEIKISVIITVYNTEKYLRECLESIINQTYSNLEIIIVDDGSTDLSAEICDLYKNMDSRIRVIHQINMGMIAARKTGVNAAQGEYISFIDSDDYIDPEMYMKVVDTINKYNNLDCVIFGIKEIYENRKLTKKNKISAGCYNSDELEKIYDSILFNGNFFEFGVLPNLVVKIVRKEILIDSNFLSINNSVWYGEDVVGTLCLFSKIKTIAVIDFAPYNYRQNNYSNGFNTLNVSAGDLQNLCKELKNTSMKYKSPGRFAEQIKMYMYFVILLRQFEKVAMEYPDFLFPFKNIKQGMDVILYGAGQFGISVYKYLYKSKFCNVKLWVDKNADQAEKISLPVVLPDNISKTNFDYIIITVLNETTAESINCFLIRMGIDRQKILFIDKKIISDLNLPKWLEES